MRPDRWLSLVNDMLVAIEKINRYTTGVSINDLETQEMLFDAVIRQFSVLGEAANRIPQDVQQQHPDIPWSEMRRMRNFVVHQYDAINHQTILDTIQRDLPSLQTQLLGLLHGESSEQ